MADEELDVQTEDPIKAAAQEPAEPADDEPLADEPKEVPADVGIEALKLQIEQERAARIEAERRANEANSKAARSEAEVQDSNLQLVVSAIDAVKRDNMAAKRAYADAMAAGDYERAAEVQETLAINGAKLLQLENGRAALEERLKNPPKKAEAPPADPVEAVASQLSPRSAAWVRAHPECVRDRRLYMKMLGAHNIAIADGLTADSDEYFSFIEDQMGMRKREQARAPAEEQGEEPMSAAAKPVARKPQPPAAPPSRGSGSGNGRMTLTAAQREAAQIAGISEEEYARNLLNEKKRRAN